MYGMQGFPVQSYPVQPMPAPIPQPQYAQQPQPAVWQPAQPLPVKVRGVAAEPAPTRFVLPSPEALGVATNIKMPPAPVVDWSQIQARMARLGVVRYQKNALSTGGIRVTLLLANSQTPMEAQAETEAAAVLIALQHAETTVRPR